MLTKPSPYSIRSQREQDRATLVKGLVIALLCVLAAMMAAMLAKPNKADSRSLEILDMQDTIHPEAQAALDEFTERIDGHTADLAAWAEHTLNRLSAALHAVYEHDQAGFQRAFGSYTKDVLHAVFGKLSPRYGLTKFIENAAEVAAEQEAGKLYKSIASAAGEVS